MSVNTTVKDYVVGVDLGGTKVEACLVDSDKTILTRKRTLIDTTSGLETVLQTICDLIRHVAGDKSFSAVGMGTPGSYVPAEDRLYGAPNSTVYEIPGFIRRLKDDLKVPVCIENDANCLALSEFFASCEGKYKYVMAVIMGTGLGTGLILDNRLYRGACGGAGEMGHTKIVFNGRKCQCGQYGCVEAYLSGPSLSRRFFDLTQKKLEVPAIYELYLKNDPHALSLFNDSVKMLGEFFSNAVNALDLEAIILGGGVSNLPIWYQNDTAALYMKKSLFGVPRGEIPIIQARLGDSAGVLGAAYLALRERGYMNF
jgi:fructokinase